MKYYISKYTELTYEEAITKVIDCLRTEGFGVLTQLDVKKTLKNKIGADFNKYIILGTCNPIFAHKALQIEERIGIMMPCNVVVREDNQGKVEVLAINTKVTMANIQNKELLSAANKIYDKLNSVISNV